MKRLLFIAATIFYLGCSAQEKIQDATFIYNGQSLNEFVKHNLKYPSSVMKQCLMPVTFAYFKINEKGILENLVILDETPQEIKTEIQRVLKLTEGKWGPSTINNKVVVSKTFILPFFFFIWDDTTDFSCNYQEILKKQKESLSRLKTDNNSIFLNPVIIEAIRSGIKKE